MNKWRLSLVAFFSYLLLITGNLNLYADNLVQALKETDNNNPSATNTAINTITPTTTPTSASKTTPQITDTPKISVKQLTVPETVVKSDHNKLQPIYLTLSDAIALALRKNPNVDKAYLQRINDKFSLEVAQDQFEIVPKFNASFNSSLDESFTSNQQTSVAPELTMQTPFGTQFDFVWTNSFTNSFQSSNKKLIITQPLLQGIGTDVNEITLKNAYDQEILNKLTLKETIMSTVTKIINDYRNLQQAEMSLTADQTALKIAQKTVADTKKRIKAGSAAKSDIYQFQSQVATTQVTIQTDLDNLQQARAALANDLGVDPKSNLIVSTQISTPDVVPNLPLSEKLALANDQAYITDIINLRIAKRNLLAARDQARWQLNSVTTISKTSYGGGSSGQSSDDSTGLTLSIPLGLTKLKLDQAITSNKITYQDNLISLRNDKRTLINTVEQQVATINIDLKKLRLAQEAVNLQQKTLDITTKKISAGLSSGLELTIEQQNLQNAQQSLIQSEIAYLNDLATFDQTVGTTLNTWNIDIHY